MISRAAFIYLEPKARDDKQTLAQCESCRMFVPGNRGPARCVIHGSYKEVTAGGSCGFWVDWPKGSPNPEVVEDHREELDKGIQGSVTGEESGYVDEKVQCHRCKHFNQYGPKCNLFKALNMQSPRLFSLDERIEKHSCCNAWEEKY